MDPLIAAKLRVYIETIKCGKILHDYALFNAEKWFALTTLSFELYSLFLFFNVERCYELARSCQITEQERPLLAACKIARDLLLPESNEEDIV
jgi:hypothetical protein